jgi:hypothetical protein
VYPVADLLETYQAQHPTDEPPNTQFALERFASYLAHGIGPHYWTSETSIQAHAQTLSLVIRQTQEGHAQLSQFLQPLRRAESGATVVSVRQLPMDLKTPSTPGETLTAEQAAVLPTADAPELRVTLLNSASRFVNPYPHLWLGGVPTIDGKRVLLEAVWKSSGEWSPQSQQMTLPIGGSVIVAPPPGSGLAPVLVTADSILKEPEEKFDFLRTPAESSAGGPSEGDRPVDVTQPPVKRDEPTGASLQFQAVPYFPEVPSAQAFEVFVRTLPTVLRAGLDASSESAIDPAAVFPLSAQPVVNLPSVPEQPIHYVEWLAPPQAPSNVFPPSPAVAVQRVMPVPMLLQADRSTEWQIAMQELDELRARRREEEEQEQRLRAESFDERRHEARPDFERHIAEAAEHLHAAGLPDLAEHVRQHALHRRVERVQQRLREIEVTQQTLRREAEELRRQLQEWEHSAR